MRGADANKIVLSASDLGSVTRDSIGGRPDSCYFVNNDKDDVPAKAKSASHRQQWGVQGMHPDLLNQRIALITAYDNSKDEEGRDFSLHF